MNNAIVIKVARRRFLFGKNSDSPLGGFCFSTFDAQFAVRITLYSAIDGTIVDVLAAKI